TEPALAALGRWLARAREPPLTREAAFATGLEATAFAAPLKATTFTATLEATSRTLAARTATAFKAAAVITGTTTFTASLGPSLKPAAFATAFRAPLKAAAFPATALLARSRGSKFRRKLPALVGGGEDGVADESLDLLQVGLLAVVHEGDGDARRAGARRAANTVHVALGDVRHVVVDDVRDVIHV